MNQRRAVLATAGEGGQSALQRESRPSLESVGHTLGLHAGHTSGITPHPAQGAFIPGSQRQATAGLGTEAALEREYRFNAWVVECSSDPKIQHCVSFSVTVTLGIQSNLSNTVKF